MTINIWYNDIGCFIIHSMFVRNSMNWIEGPEPCLCFCSIFQAAPARLTFPARIVSTEAMDSHCSSQQLQIYTVCYQSHHNSSQCILHWKDKLLSRHTRFSGEGTVDNYSVSCWGTFLLPSDLWWYNLAIFRLSQSLNILRWKGFSGFVLLNLWYV